MQISQVSAVVAISLPVSIIYEEVRNLFELKQKQWFLTSNSLLSSTTK